MTSEAYTPGGVTSVLAAVSSGKKGKSKAENKAVLDLFSKKIPKFDYGAPTEAVESKKIIAKSVKVAKKRKLKEQEDEVQDNSDKTKKKKKKKQVKLPEKQKNTDLKEKQNSSQAAKISRKDSTGLKKQDVDIKKKKKAAEDEKVKTAQGSKKQKSPKHVKLEDETTETTSSDKKKKTKKKKPRSPPGPERDSRTVFVGNLPTTYTKKKLYKVFKKCGKIESVRFRSAVGADLKLPKKAVVIKQAFHSEKHNINAYVVFVEETSVHKALELNGTKLEGQVIRVDRTGEEKQHDHNKSVFIGNMPFDAEEDALRDHFDECGDITNVRIIRDKKTGLGKGIGYVQFSDSAAVGLALKLTSDLFQGRNLRIVRSTANPQERGQKTTKQRGKDSERRVRPPKRRGDKTQKTTKGQRDKSVGSKKPTDQPPADRDSFQGSKVETDGKQKTKVNAKKKLKARHKDSRKKTLKSIFAGSKEAQDKKSKLELKKVSQSKKKLKEVKPKEPNRGQKASFKSGKVYARNRLSKKLKQTRKS